MAGRLAFSLLLVIAELLALSIAVDTGDLRVTTGLGGWLADWGPIGARILLLGMTLTVVFGGFTAGRPIVREQAGSWLSKRALIAHLIALTAFSVTAVRLFNPLTSASAAGVLAVGCIAGGLATVVTALLLVLPVSFWLEWLRAALLAPVYGFSTAAATFGLVRASRWIWKPWLDLTFSAVQTVLRWIRSDVVAHSATYTIGTKSFAVTISAACSGYEGIALMLLFGSTWLWLFRREFRFPRSLLLLPVGMLAMWILNVVRITALILIGDAGAPAVALGGFHSQAGWIAFLCMALAFMLASQRVAWFAAPRMGVGVAARAEDDATAAYLIPFLAILGAGILSSAVKGTFEWAYGLRVFCAAAALLYYRRKYAGVSLRVGWEAPAAGILVFAIWIGAERLFFPHAPYVAMPWPLAAACAPARVGWLLLRVLGAIVTVPVAEELAFRGYLLRRLAGAEFSSVDFRRFHFLPFALSSLMFGILHGQRWIAGTVAGMVYAAVTRRRGSLGDAVIAHAATNALIAVLVLTTGNWNLW